MELKLMFILFSVILLVNGANVSIDPEPTPKPSPTSTSTIKPITSTEKPTTSTEKPTTSTEKPTSSTPPTTSTTTTTTTTTQKPTTTSTPMPTPPPTTSTEKPTTSSEKPVTTTAAPTTTAVPPKPLPDPLPATYNVTDGANKTCIIINMALQFSITYQAPNNKSYTTKVNMPTNASVAGSCGNITQFINITWFSDPNNNTKDMENFILLNFNKNVTTKKFEISNFTSVIIRDKTFVGLNISVQKIDLSYPKELFAAPLNMSYKCYKSESRQLNSTVPVHAEMIVSHLQLQAFHEKTGAVFDTAEDCEPADTPDIVPIAVGCALAGLVIIVLIAYLIGRRRSQARGYLSMLLNYENEDAEDIPMKDLNCFGR